VVEIRSGDLLVFYTDGVTEALDYDDNLYGLDRFKQSILRHRDATAPTMANQLLWDVRRFAGLTRQADDITIVVAKVDGANK
jgi:sigma-B regulation protein RsbU (phosphoserine phosphatase)